MSLDQVQKIISEIQSKQLAPIYFLCGDEPYYIDRIAAFIEDSVLNEEEKGFNQVVLYGRDVSIEDIVSQAKRYPMMAERQVVIVKEAQELSRTIENLESYASQPQESTVLVLCYKYKKLDARKKLKKTLAKTGVIFESKKLYDNQIPEWIRRVLSGKGYQITPKASLMLSEFLGNDLSKVNNELEKLQLIVPKGSEITPHIIEENIGISKDFNTFELQHAVGKRDTTKAFSIANYFANNPRNHPLVVTLGVLYNFFSKVMLYHSLTHKAGAAKTLGVNPYFVKDYEIAAQNYSMKKVSQILSVLHETDLKGKGVGAQNIPQGELLKEMLVKIFS